MRLYFSTQAYAAIYSETYAYKSLETGGVYLGKVENNSWYVIEVIDPGYEEILRQPAYFEYDKVYVTHLANIRARLYDQGLDLLGLWHRHPGSFDRFSATDDETHRLFVAQNPKRGIVSSLVNLDPEFRLTNYHVDGKIHHHKFKSVTVGDEHIPEKFLKNKDYLNRAASKPHSEAESGGKTSFWKSINPFRGKNIQECVIDDSDSEKALDEILDILEEEFVYLESQSVYDCRSLFDKDNMKLSLTLRFNGSDFDKAHYPAEMKFEFYPVNKKLFYKLDEIGKPYNTPIVEKHVNSSITA